MVLVINELNRKASNQQKNVSETWASKNREGMESQLFHCGF